MIKRTEVYDTNEKCWSIYFRFLLSFERERPFPEIFYTVNRYFSHTGTAGVISLAICRISFVAYSGGFSASFTNAISSSVSMFMPPIIHL